ncbi:hypothetical protein Moror_6859 [Moniliophthora roreri MCA 2997]|uniref:Mmc1 C-terminal domain-containing protein n=2 Tax=Moniliophthora roreri TaxID=221103 RepID=V2YY78_MONRO|nr:hypothetical protein Moror_6859 [Moniliophthora roreri MCA 2997]KAI3618651.1 hypothetical protein WG66_016613 [Moniliophthora roreri]
MRNSAAKLVLYGHKDLIELVTNVILDAPFKSSSTSSSPFLQELPVKVDIEQRPTLAPPQDADIPICVVDPFSTPLESLQIHNPNTILVFTSIPPYQPKLSYRNIRAVDPRNILFVNPLRARAGLDAIHADPSSPTAVQRYQDEFNGSRIGDITRAIKSYFSSSGTLQAIHKRSRLAELAVADAEINHVLDAVSGLRTTVEEKRVKVLSEVLKDDPVRHALQQAKMEVKPVVDKLTWWRMLWSLDEISSHVSDAVQRSWCRDLEKQLIYHAGSLSILQSNLESSAFSLLPSPENCSFPIPSPFSSPVLHNSLLQKTHLPTYPLTPCSLTSPITTRRNQIIQYPTTRLHLAGQQSALGIGASIASGVGLSWAAWVGSLNLTIPIIHHMNDPATALGFGLLTAAVGVRWGQGRWEKAKKRWWEDWDRVGDGLERDIRRTLENVLDDNVLGVPTKVCKGLEALAKERKELVECRREELELNDPSSKSDISSGNKD